MLKNEQAYFYFSIFYILFFFILNTRLQNKLQKRPLKQTNIKSLNIIFGFALVFKQYLQIIIFTKSNNQCSDKPGP